MTQPEIFKASFVKQDTNDLHQECPVSSEKFETQTITQNFCNVCNLTFENKESFESHTVYHNARPYRCNICKYSFKRKTHLDRHKQCVHTNDLGDFVCAVCAEKCSDENDLHNHLLSHLNSDWKKCNQCNLKFENKEDFKEHIKIHDARPHSCSECDRGFKHRQHLDRHIREVHADDKNEVRAYKCSVCTSSFMRKLQLDRHMKTHERDDSKTPFQCDVCGACYMTNHHLKRHLKFHTLLTDSSDKQTENDKQYSCDECDSKFKTKYHLHRHLKTHENVELSRTKCAICQRFFNNKVEFVQHMKVHMKDSQLNCINSETEISNQTHSDIDEDSNMSPEESKPKTKILTNLLDEFSDSSESNLDTPDLAEVTDLQDQIIIKTDVSKYTIIKKEREENEFSHQTTSGQSELMQLSSTELQFICDVCNEPFGKKSALVNHRKTHEGFEMDVGFKCEVCEKSFETRRKLRVHSRTHGQKQFNCEFCNKNFRTRQSLDLHTKIHTAVKDFPCPMCQKAFRTKQHLLVHGKVHAKETLKSEQEKSSNFVVEVKKEEEDEQLKNMMIDVANKYLSETFQCEFCGKNFSTKQNMQLHLKIHLDIKDFLCDVCNKGFRTKQQLKLHQNKHKEKIATDPLQFVCELCKKVYSTKQNLGVHLKVHLDVRDFVCVVCRKGFRTKQQLKNHEKIHKTLNKKNGKKKGEHKVEETKKKVESGEKESVEELLMEISNIEEMLECRIEGGNEESKATSST